MKGVPPDGAIAFDNAPAYERFMGDWSRAAGAAFLDWLAPASALRWLEIGCGTGAFTELVHRRCAPSAMIAIDPATAQIEYCCRQPIAKHVEFRVADAIGLPFSDASFDVIAHALVFNFIPDSQGALREMRRVGHPGGLIAGFVWDFGAERAPNSCIALGLQKIGCAAGLKDINVTSFDVGVTFSDFDEFWHAQTPSFSPLVPIINTLSCANQKKLVDLVRDRLASDREGRICGMARVNAIKARVP
jgi:ubiquinone/menaquinone biosynthesis C-methylase UbiE